MVSSGIEQPAHVTLNIRVVRLLATVLVRNVVWEGMQHAAAARCVPRCCADRRPDPHHRRAAGSPMPNANATTGTFAAEKEQFAQADRRSKEQGHLALPLKVSPTARRSEQHRAAISRRRSMSHRDRKQPRVAPDMAQTQQPSRTTPPERGLRQAPTGLRPDVQEQAAPGLHGDGAHDPARHGPHADRLSRHDHWRARRVPEHRRRAINEV